MGHIQEKGLFLATPALACFNPKESKVPATLSLAWRVNIKVDHVRRTQLNGWATD